MGHLSNEPACWLCVCMCVCARLSQAPSPRVRPEHVVDVSRDRSGGAFGGCGCVSPSRKVPVTSLTLSSPVMAWLCVPTGLAVSIWTGVRVSVHTCSVTAGSQAARGVGSVPTGGMKIAPHITGISSHMEHTRAHPQCRGLHCVCLLCARHVLQGVWHREGCALQMGVCVCVCVQA